MLIHTLPPRRMYLVMAIRAASICRLVTQAGSIACRPYSPKVTEVPPVAMPPRRGRCCLRCFTRLGVKMLGTPSPARALPGRWAGRGPPGARRGRARGPCGLALAGTSAATAAIAVTVTVAAVTGAGTRPGAIGLLLLARGQDGAAGDTD